MHSYAESKYSDEKLNFKHFLWGWRGGGEFSVNLLDHWMHTTPQPERVNFVSGETITLHIIDKGFRLTCVIITQQKS